MPASVNGVSALMCYSIVLLTLIFQADQSRCKCSTDEGFVICVELCALLLMLSSSRCCSDGIASFPRRSKRLEPHITVIRAAFRRKLAILPEGNEKSNHRGWKEIKEISSKCCNVKKNLAINKLRLCVCSDLYNNITEWQPISTLWIVK